MLKIISTREDRSLQNCRQCARLYSANRASRAFRSCAFAIAVSCSLACASKLDREHPPALGDCTPTAEAGCAAPGYGTGLGGSPKTGDAQSAADTSDALAFDAGVDAGVCGASTLTLMPANATCLPCLAVPAPNGCCEAVTACSADTTCSMRVTCAAFGSQGSCSVDTTFTDFVACLSSRCGSQCSDIEMILTRDF